MAVDTIGTYRRPISLSDRRSQNNKSACPTVSLSRSRIFIFDDEELPVVEGSPVVTILEMYPDTAATTSMVNERRGEGEA